jgi:L-2-hydroxyglutarate oxidase LhgO
LDRTDLVIIGAGVIGLAVAAAIAERASGLQLLVIEQNEKFGMETSSRNSEVIHSGLYYPAGSIKARHCVEGNKLLYSYCAKWGIPHKRLGKLILAVEPGDLPSIEELELKAKNNGVEGAVMLSEGQVKALEPNLACRGALLVPSTGIVDSYAYMRRLEQQALQGGALIAYCHRLCGVEPVAEGYKLSFINPDGSMEAIVTSALVNCAGLGADQVAAWLGINIDEEGYRLHFCKGEYFSVSHGKAKLVDRLVYPPPLADLKGLGIHLTKTMDGSIKLGPNAFYVDHLNYDVDPGHVDDFYEAVKGFLPFLRLEDLNPDMAGIRPKLQGPGEPFRDFIIKNEKSRGLSGVINLVGIESPGLTCSLSIARWVAEQF